VLYPFYEFFQKGISEFFFRHPHYIGDPDKETMPDDMDTRLAALEAQLAKATLASANTTQGQPQGQDGQVSHVSVKLPLFAEQHATAWFAIIEGQFELSRVTMKTTKFYHALSALPPNIVSKIPQSALESKDYEELKKAVLILYEESKTETFNRLISRARLDPLERPSVFLADLKNKARRYEVGDDFVRHRFLQVLPPSLLPVLAAQEDLSLDALGRLADSLSEHLANAPLPTVMAAQPTQTSHSPSRQSRRDHDDTRRKRHTMEPFHAGQRPLVCRGHVYYGRQSRSCRSWCQFPRNGNEKIVNSRASSPAPVPQQGN